MLKDEYNWLNFVLGNELDVAGALIFEGLENITQLKVISNADEVFTILYFLSQGFERLVKVASLIADENPKSKIKDIFGHDTNKKFEDYLNNSIPTKKEHKELLNILSEFYANRYNHIDYGAQSPEKRKEYPEGDFSMYPNMLREYVRKYCNPQIERIYYGSKEYMRCSTDIKRFLHLVVKELAMNIYVYIRSCSSGKGLFIYELRYDSKAFYVFLAEGDYLLRKKVAIYELMLYAMRGKGFMDKEIRISVKPLELDIQYIKEIVNTLNSKTDVYDVLDTIDAQIEDMAPELREERLLLHSYFIED